MGELKHLSTPRKRDYSLSSGERKGRSPNRAGVRMQPLLARGCGVWAGSPARDPGPLWWLAERSGKGDDTG